MPLYVQWPASNALIGRLDAIRAAAKPGSPANTRVLGDIRNIVIRDNIDKLLGRGLLEGVDRHGKPLTPMAPSTYRNKRRGFGPVLVPRGMQSRFVANFEAVWQRLGSRNVLAMRYRDFVSKKGFPIPVAHLTGAIKPGTNWVLPKRDVGGITPAGWAKIKARHTKFAGDVLKGG